MPDKKTPEAECLERHDMSLLAKLLSTPDMCMQRISAAMDKVKAIQALLNATPQRRNYEEDWDSNRKYAQGHLLEAWGSLNAAGHGLAPDCDRCPTHREQRDTDVRMNIALEAEINRLKELWLRQMRS
jgi:hypothetical protein